MLFFKDYYYDYYYFFFGIEASQGKLVEAVSTIRTGIHEILNQRVLQGI